MADDDAIQRPFGKLRPRILGPQIVPQPAGATSDGHPRRISQLPVESIIGGTTSATARTSQLAIEPVILPTDAKARMSQLAVEVIVKPVGPARLSQLVVEAIQRVPHGSVSITWIDG